jgi:hypothetical protein
MSVGARHAFGAQSRRCRDGSFFSSTIHMASLGCFISKIRYKNFSVILKCIGFTEIFYSVWYDWMDSLELYSL